MLVPCAAGCWPAAQPPLLWVVYTLFSSHIDSIAAGGLIIDDVWYGRRVITVDLLGAEFLEAVNTGDPISVKEDGTVEVG